MPGPPSQSPLPWDERSDQPAVITDRALRRRLRGGAWRDWLKTAVTVPVMALPIAAAALRPWPRGSASALQVGVGISPLDQDPAAIATALAELGAGRVLVRFEWRRAHRWAKLAAAIRTVNLPTLAVLVQDRAAVGDRRRWRAGLQRLREVLPDQVEAIQVGQAVNRLKWGCATGGEALALAEDACAWQRTLPRRPLLLGSAVIDFEPLATVRSLINGAAIRYDGVAALLYVDRRGSPRNCQAGIFDLAAKIRTIAAIIAVSPHCAKRLWLTEFNWPLTGQAGWAPTSPQECVDEMTAAKFTVDYLAIAAATGLVERAYHWQLFARGYGLIDPRDGRRRPAFTALARWIADNS